MSTPIFTGSDFNWLKTAVTSATKVSGRQICSNSVHYFIIFGGNAESLQQAAAKTENNSQVERHTATDLDCRAKNPLLKVKNFCKQLEACMSSNGWHFEHKM